MNKQDGFSLAGGLLIIIVFCMLGFAGYFVWNKTNKNDNSTQQTDSKNSSDVVTTNNKGFSYEVVIPYDYEIAENDVNAESIDIKVSSDNFDETLIISPLEDQNISQELAECDGYKAIEYAINTYGTIPICDPNNNGLLYTMFFKVDNTWHGATLLNINFTNPSNKEPRTVLAKQIFESIKIIK